MDKNKILIASDHGAFELKEKLKARMIKLGLLVEDLGVHSTESVDYPDYAVKVARLISEKKYERGILLCGTGIGMSIAANKFPGVRATPVHDHYTAKMSRLHNNSNILVLGGRTTGEETAYNILETWLNTAYEGGRHDLRLRKIEDLENGSAPAPARDSGKEKK